MLSMKSTDESLSTTSLGTSNDPPHQPASWWEWFSKGALASQKGDQIFGALNKAIQLFSVDVHRGDPSLLKIWLAFLEAHL
jgi:hypothetical protein